MKEVATINPMTHPDLMTAYTKLPLDIIVCLENNPRTIEQEDLDQLCKDIQSDPSFLQQRTPLINLVNGKYLCYAGQQRIKAMCQLGYTHAWCFVQENIPQEVQDKRMVLDNTHRGKWDIQSLIDNFDFNIDQLKGLGIPDAEFNDLYIDAPGSDIKKEEARKSLAERFLIPPFSVLDSRQGYWQDRKRKWLDLGINSQETREDIELIAKSGQSTHIYELRNKMREQLGRDPEWDEIIAQAKAMKLHVYEGASIFDPVLAEVCYSWFCPAGGTIIDPFAGGSVRGIVASHLGFQYHGVDLRADQVEANFRQAKEMNQSGCTWYTGNSEELDHIIPLELYADFIFSCPPYHDLEIYSEDPADLSNMDYSDFQDAYRDIIIKAVDCLKPNRFACFVIGEIRDKAGFYKNFVVDTIRSFEDAGAKYYNEIILVTVTGSLAIRAGRQFNAGRKIGKTHQNVLVFYKGDPKAIKAEFPELDLSDTFAENE